MICLGLFLILIAVIGLFGVSLGGAAIIVPILALVAGVAILLGR